MCLLDHFYRTNINRDYKVNVLHHRLHLCHNCVTRPLLNWTRYLLLSDEAAAKVLTFVIDNTFNNYETVQDQHWYQAQAVATSSTLRTCMQRQNCYRSTCLGGKGEPMWQGSGTSFRSYDAARSIHLGVTISHQPLWVNTTALWDSSFMQGVYWNYQS